MAKKTKLRPWTKEDVRTLKTLARDKDKDDRHRAQAEAQRGGDASESDETWRDAGGAVGETRAFGIASNA